MADRKKANCVNTRASRGKCIWFKFSHGSVNVGYDVSSLKIVQWRW